MRHQVIIPDRLSEERYISGIHALNVAISVIGKTKNFI